MWQLRYPIEIWNCLGESGSARLRDQFGFIPEMRVESTVGQPRPAHDFIQPRFSHSALPEGLAGRVENPLPSEMLVFSRVAHSIH